MKRIRVVGRGGVCVFALLLIAGCIPFERRMQDELSQQRMDSVLSKSDLGRVRHGDAFVTLKRVFDGDAAVPIVASADFSHLYGTTRLHVTWIDEQPKADQIVIFSRGKEIASWEIGRSQRRANKKRAEFGVVYHAQFLWHHTEACPLSGVADMSVAVRDKQGRTSEPRNVRNYVEEQNEK